MAILPRRRLLPSALQSLLLALFCLGTNIHAQATAGEWDFSSWFSDSDTVDGGHSPASVGSSGPPVVQVGGSFLYSGLAGGQFLSGGSGGTVVLENRFETNGSTSLSYSHQETFTFTDPINFGSNGQQSTVFGDPDASNGFGFYVTLPSALEHILGYNLTITVTGGGVFSIMGGFTLSRLELVNGGVGTSSATFEWNPGSTNPNQVIYFDAIRIVGDVSSITVTHDVLLSPDADAGPGDNIVNYQISSLPSLVPEPSGLLLATFAGLLGILRRTRHAA